jgi:hypothetical protein
MSLAIFYADLFAVALAKEDARVRPTRRYNGGLSLRLRRLAVCDYGTNVP